MKNNKTQTIVCLASCMMLFVCAASQAKNNANSMQTTVAKAAAGLAQTAIGQFRAGKDSAGAQTCLELYDLDNEANREWLVKAGDAFARAGKTDRAKAAFDRYLEKRSSPSVAAKLAAVEFTRKNYARVVELSKQFSNLVASQTALAMIVAESYFASGAYDEVLSLLPEAKQRGNARALELAAMSGEKMGDFKTALSYYEKLLGAAPLARRPDFSFRVAVLSEETNQITKAVKAYEKNIVEFPADLRNYDRLSRLYIADSKWRQAQLLLEKAVTLPEAKPALEKMLGQCLAAQANRFAAVNQYRQYLAKAPGDSAAWFELGSVYNEQEHYAEAVEALKKSVALMPKNSEWLTLLGECSIKTGDIRSAVAPLEQSRLIDKKNIRVLSQLASCYRTLHDTKKLMSVVKDWAMLDVKNSDARIELAEMYMQDQKWREAISALESALSIDSTIARAHLLFARACEKTANENGRFSHLKKAYKFSTDNAEILYELGRLYAGRNQLAAARPLLARAVSVDPMHAGAQFEYARVLWTAGDKNGAYEHFSNAAQLDPFNSSYLVQFAQTAFATGKRDVAFDYIKKALSRDSTQFEVLQWAGILYKEAGNTELARTLLLKAVVRSSKCASCYKYLADIYYENGEYDLAVKFYNQSLSIGSYSEAASLGLGNSLIMSGDFEKARQMYEKIFSGNTKGEETLYRLCSVYLRMDMLDKAIILFSQYAGERKSGWIQLTRGEIAEASGQLDDALIAFTVTSTLMPENPLAHAGAGRINLVKKENDKAIENFGRALGYAPHNVDILLGMGKAYEGTGQFQEAFEMYAEVARKAPRQPEVFGLMARVLGQQQQHDQAITVFKRGLELNPKNATLSYGLGRELRDMMQFAEAIKAFKKSVRTRNDEKRFFEAYRNIGDIYYYDLKNPDKAKDFYKKYMKFGGKDEAVATLVNGMKN